MPSLAEKYAKWDKIEVRSFVRSLRNQRYTII